MFDYDLLVIGSGSGGVTAAKLAVEKNKKVAIVESAEIGGTCINRGCIPKKIIYYGASVGRSLCQPGMAELGWQLKGSSFAWEQLQATLSKVVSRMSQSVTKSLERQNITILRGVSVLVDRHTLEVSGHGKVTAENIMIANGGVPITPDIPGKEHVICSDDVFRLSRLPQTMTIVGGGYIAIEFACMFNALGTKVTMIHRNDRLLRSFDGEVVQLLLEQMREAGITVRLGRQLVRAESQASQLLAHLDNGEQIVSEKILAAIGRAPKVAGLNLEKVGVAQRQDGSIITDDKMCTSVANIYAAGDVTGGEALTPVATREAEIFADQLYGSSDPHLKVRLTPKAVFSLPPIAGVGLTEEFARQQFDQVRIYRNRFVSLKSRLVLDRTPTLFKIITVGTDEKVVGFHAVAEEAAEIIQTVAIALTRGLNKAELDRTIKLHPTTAESLLLAQNS